MAQGIADQRREIDDQRNAGSPAVPWEPELSKSQLAAYRDNRRIVEVDGPKGSGKTTGALHKLVRHCYLCTNSLAVIYVIEKFTGKAGGAWETLNTIERTSDGKSLGVLQQWGDEVGLKYTEAREDSTHGAYVQLTNKYGGISEIRFKPLPKGKAIEGKQYGLQTDFILIDEYNQASNPVEVITKLYMNIGRRPGVEMQDDDGVWHPAPQQLVLCCNPPDLGPDDPAGQLLFQKLPGLEGRPPIFESEGDTAVFVRNDDPVIGRWSVPMTENIWMADRDAYISAVRLQSAIDPTAEDRLVHGIWRKAPTGQGMFSPFFRPDVHVRPAPDDPAPASAGLLPLVGAPIYIGYDPGDVNNARIFMQYLRVEGGGFIWRIFDEIVDTSTKISIDAKVRQEMERRKFWCEVMGNDFVFVDVADRQALTRYNTMGGYEYRQFETISARMIAEEPRYKGMVPIYMLAPDKGSGTVGERVQIFRDLLMTNSIIVSRRCRQVVEMITQLRCGRDRNGADTEFKPMRSRYLHVFDAATYPMLFAAQRGLDRIVDKVENELESYQLTI